MRRHPLIPADRFASVDSERAGDRGRILLSGLFVLGLAAVSSRPSTGPLTPQASGLLPRMVQPERAWHRLAEDQEPSLLAARAGACAGRAQGAEPVPVRLRPLLWRISRSRR